ncbi:MAG: putative Bacterial type secretion system protein domain protein [Acidobacteriaceae bacterium]|nr:putative Bacterial type secretion system protein domain protein [Acidobacteriaceae bacterium]
MSLILLFALLLILLFGLLLYFLKPTSIEKAVEEQLASIEEAQPHASDRITILKQQTVRSGTLEELAQKIPGSPAVSRLIRQSGRDWPLGSVFLFSLIAGLGSYWLVSLVVPGAVISLGICIAVGSAPYVYLYILREIRFKRFAALLPEAVDLMSRGLRAGHSISAVMEMVGNEVADPVGLEFRALHKEQSLGLPTRDALIGLIDRIPLDDMRFLATAILLQKESGGNLAQILDKTSEVVRERARLRGQLQIYTAQGRITGWILCAAPFVMFGIINTLNHQYEKALLSDPFGLKMVYFGLGLMVIGILAIRKIIDVKI